MNIPTILQKILNARKIYGFRKFKCPLLKVHDQVDENKELFKDLLDVAFSWTLFGQGSWAVHIQGEKCENSSFPL